MKFTIDSTTKAIHPVRVDLEISSQDLSKIMRNDLNPDDGSDPLWKQIESTVDGVRSVGYDFNQWGNTSFLLVSIDAKMVEDDYMWSQIEVCVNDWLSKDHEYNAPKMWTKRKYEIVVRRGNDGRIDVVKYPKSLPADLVGFFALLDEGNERWDFEAYWDLLVDYNQDRDDAVKYSLSRHATEIKITGEHTAS